MKKKLVSLLVGLVCGVTSVDADVVFNFDYTAAPDFNATSMASLESAAAITAQFFAAYNATIDMAVTSSNANTSTLASAGSEFASPLSDGFGNRGVVGLKILGGTDPNGAGADGTVDVNFFHNWDFDDNVDPAAFDFQSTMIHELLHAVGFTSATTDDGSSFLAGIAGSDSPYLPFDEFLADSTGRLISAGGSINTTRWNTAKVGGPGTVPPTSGTGLYFDGPLANAENGGNPVPLYSQGPTYDSGSTAAHTDDEYFNGTNPPMLIMNAATIAGPGIRNLSPIEVGILRDIGFAQVVAIPEPSPVLLLSLVGLVIVVGKRIVQPNQRA